MLKMRKYIEGEVIESDFMGTNSRPVTQIVQEQISRAISNSQTTQTNYEINNLHLREHIETGVLYKDVRGKVELARMGPREIYMPLLSNTSKRAKVIIPPIYVFIDRNQVSIGIRPEKGNPFNPYTNVFHDSHTTTLRDKNGRPFTFSLARVCLGSEINNKLNRDFVNGSYKAFDLLIDWLVSTPNHDLSLTRSFSFVGFEDYLTEALNEGCITKDQIQNIYELVSNSDWEIDNGNRLSYDYDYMLILHHAITAIAPNIASDFIIKSYVEGDGATYNHSSVENILKKFFE